MNPERLSGWHPLLAAFEYPDSACAKYSFCRVGFFYLKFSVSHHSIFRTWSETSASISVTDTTTGFKGMLTGSWPFWVHRVQFRRWFQREVNCTFIEEGKVVFLLTIRIFFVPRKQIPTSLSSQPTVAILEHLETPVRIFELMENLSAGTRSSPPQRWVRKSYICGWFQIKYQTKSPEKPSG